MVTAVLAVATAGALGVALAGTGEALPQVAVAPVAASTRAPAVVWRTVSVHGVPRQYLLVLPAATGAVRGARATAAGVRGAPAARVVAAPAAAVPPREPAAPTSRVAPAASPAGSVGVPTTVSTGPSTGGSTAASAAASTTGRPPLVVAYHGLFQRPGRFADLTGLAAAATANGVVLAVPESVHGIWNDGRLGAAGPDDDAFFVALVAQLVREGRVDPHRVTVAGFSNGAGMAMEIAARHPRAVAALVSVCGELLAAPGSPRPRRPVATAVFVHGTADRVQPWDGRPRWNAAYVAYVSVPRTVDAFVRVLGRHGAPTAAELAPAATGPGDRAGPVGPDPARVSVSSWHDRRGRSVSFYVLDGFDHAWPVDHAVTRAQPHGVTIARSPLDATAVTIHTALTARLVSTGH